MDRSLAERLPSPHAPHGHGRKLHTPRVILSSPSRNPTLDIRKRMDDIYSEMERNARSGRFRMPVKFLDFHKSEVMYLFVRAAVAYALAFVRVKALQNDRALDEAGSSNQLISDIKSTLLQHSPHRPLPTKSVALPSSTTSSIATPRRSLIEDEIHLAIEQHSGCASELAATYARLVLHCSNYEHHKEDEHFFECIYFFVCAVVKVGLVSEHWTAIEEELGFLFRGTQFSSIVKKHANTNSSHDMAPPTMSSSVLSSISLSSESASSASKKIQSLSSTSTLSRGNETPDRAEAKALFILPKTRYCHFNESVPVDKIVSELNAAKLRATRNMEISQNIRGHIRQQQLNENRRRQLQALTSPRWSVKVTDALSESPQSNPPLTSRSVAKGVRSPRVAMKSMFTARSPALNHLIPGTEDRVRNALAEYEREFQRKLLAQHENT
ncbi:hypothetical protein Poli38472_012870 [Pythium oligandrum]|uniref:Uncharacterized protein n=1 Tax=Pythium oligandrum TaxID=41045 RepID=A0A8K1CJU0_PYTOL|nr:hypothetical protein Poli38472_012870 [Pythium oligandrum]|eukprot:TMW64248.1 hypothetical protein Poli38472_012870 [Pythium oligandrum]